MILRLSPFPTCRSGTVRSGDVGTDMLIPAERKSVGQVPLLPAQVTPGANGMPAGYGYAGTPGTPGTPLGGASSRRAAAGPSRLHNVAYASPAHGTPGAHGIGTPGQPGAGGQAAPNLAFLQQQQQQMQQAQLRIAQAQAHQLAQQQLASQAQLAQLQAQQQHGGAGAHPGMGGGAMGAHGVGHLGAGIGVKRKRGDEDVKRGHDEVETEAEGEDLTPYCFCHRPSFGEVRSTSAVRLEVAAVSTAVIKL